MKILLAAASAALLIPVTQAQVSVQHVDVSPAIGFSQWTGYSMAGVGDVDADGYDDLLVGVTGYDDQAGQSFGRARIHFGGATPGARFLNLVPGPFSGGDYGREVAGLGDVNGDSYPDFAVAGRGTFELGRVDVFFGGPSLDEFADLYIESGTIFGGLDPEFGRALAGGDVNGDGISDIIVTSPAHDNGQVVLGAVFVYYGRDGGWPSCCLGPFDHDWYAEGGYWEQLGQDVVYMPNADGDSIGDFAVGMLDSRVAIFSGGSTPSRGADLILNGTSGVDQSRQLAAGDFFNDGRTDLVVSEVRSGAASLGWIADHFVALYKNTGTLQHERTFVGAVIPPDYVNSFGSSIAVSRLIDGKLALAISSPFDDLYGPPKTKVSLRNAADVQITGDAGSAFDGLGLVVANAGDMNGDGREDLAALASDNRIRVYLGTTSGGGGSGGRLPDIGQH